MFIHVHMFFHLGSLFEWFTAFLTCSIYYFNANHCLFFKPTIYPFIVNITAYPSFPSPNALFPLLTQESGIDAKLISEAEVGPSPRHCGIRCQIDMAKGQNIKESPGLSHLFFGWDWWCSFSVKWSDRYSHIAILIVFCDEYCESDRILTLKTLYWNDKFIVWFSM